MNRNHRATAARLILLAFVLLSGCTRAFYRKQADCECNTLVLRDFNDPRWTLNDYRIYPDPRSRFYDPDRLDYPAMPPDDPFAHRLMHCVDCKHGYPCWHKMGDNPFVENPSWQKYLPLDEDGSLTLSFKDSVLVSYIHSRDYQSQLETLYLSALDVTFERFRFDVQFFGATNTTTAAFAGPIASGRPNGSNTLTTATTPQAQRLFATGGQLVVEAANNIVWQFAGPTRSVDTTVASFSFLQPLLRGASRAVVLERLTLAERTLLYNVRTMYRYHQGFYLTLFTGIPAPTGPGRVGGLTGGSGLNGFSGVGANGFGRIGAVGSSTPTGTGFTGGAGAAQANGYLGILQDALQIQNQEANVASLRDTLAQLESAYDAGRIDRFQVDLTRQALFNSVSLLLNARAVYQQTIDSYKLALGIPPHMTVKIDDPLLNEFELISPDLLGVQEDVGDLLDDLRNPELPAGTPLSQHQLDETLAIRRGAAARFAALENDFQRLIQAKPTRIAILRKLLLRAEQERIEVGPLAYSEEAFLRRIGEVERDYLSLNNEFDAASQQVLDFANQPPDAWPSQRRELINLVTTLSSILERLLLIQARTRLDALSIPLTDLDSVKALRIAATNRLDWMNARGALVDQWRLIQFNANALKSGLNLQVNGNLGTVNNNPLSFSGTNGSISVGLEFDAPLTRVQERNNYRQAVMQYLQARRGYMQFVDSVDWDVRADLRQIHLNEMNFELNRAAVFIAIDQVDVTTLRIRQPPQPGEQSLLGPTAARDLTGAITNLLSVQNNFLSVWVNNELQRMNFDMDLGTMTFDDQGIWIDPGPISDGEFDARGHKICRDPVMAEDYPELNSLLFPDEAPQQPNQSPENTGEPM